MAMAKIFRSGNSQAVKLPKEFILDTKEVEIFRRGDEIILRPKRQSWESYFKQSRRFTLDFPDSTEDFQPEERNGI